MISRSPVLEELEEPIQTFVREKRTALPLSAIQRFSDGHDGRCNLACPSCRDGLHGIPREELDAYDLVEKEILKLLRYVEEYDTSLQGDPFASPFTRNLLKTMDPRFYPRLKIISIETNGQLLDQQMWAAMSLIHPLIRIILISVDAAAPETYEINRCPGKWNRLIDNIEYLAGVRAQMDDPFHFHLKFVVQQNNFRELPRFIELCRQWKATAFLQYLENWGTYTENDFNRRAVHRPEHPEYMQLRRILDMPELHQPHVDWGTLTAVGLSPA
jgi:MoaA/NifB/PqqE/SkfB family radical SAM enzyme